MYIYIYNIYIYIYIFIYIYLYIYCLFVTGQLNTRQLTAAKMRPHVFKHWYNKIANNTKAP